MRVCSFPSKRLNVEELDN